MGRVIGNLHCDWSWTFEKQLPKYKYILNLDIFMGKEDIPALGRS